LDGAVASSGALLKEELYISITPIASPFPSSPKEIAAHGLFHIRAIGK